ncbi:MAG: hypothetical protein METHSR3v1_260019 [Methanothrix sp.]|nr:MAG: hypothetical protein METHSR3v1_260019 [Methanothrix sp.]
MKGEKRAELIKLIQLALRCIEWVAG